jgi:tetratricopeptide (TPR) repeat protein
MTLAALRLATGELRATVRALHEVLERAPLHAQAQHALGKLLVESGFVEEGVPRLELARRLQPGLALAYIELARTHALFGRRAEAERVLAEAVSTLGEAVGIFPSVRLAFWWADPAYARATADLVERHASGAAWEASIPLLRAFAEGHADPSAPAVFARLVEGSRAAPHHRCFMHQISAEYYGAVGDRARALTALERAAELPLIDVTWLDRCPALARVRDDPRFLRLRAAVGVRAAELWA